jgi:hypothetical protein
LVTDKRALEAIIRVACETDGLGFAFDDFYLLFG